MMLSACLLSLLCASPEGLAQAQRDFDAANQQVLSGQPATGIALYQSLLEQGYEDPDVFLNLGNAQAESGNLVEAVLAYERGLKRAPGDDDLAHNLLTVRDELGLTADGVDNPFFSDLIVPVAALLPLQVAFWGTLIGSWFWLIVLLPSHAFKQKGQAIRTVIITAAILFLGIGLSIMGSRTYILHEAKAVILTDTPARNGPASGFSQTGVFTQGEGVKVLETEGPWRKVIDRKGVEGWVPEASTSSV
jgi:tetratricopeptide (TPR) repeat protein